MWWASGLPAASCCTPDRTCCRSGGACWPYRSGHCGTARRKQAGTDSRRFESAASRRANDRDPRSHPDPPPVPAERRSQTTQASPLGGIVSAHTRRPGVDIARRTCYAAERGKQVKGDTKLRACGKSDGQIATRACQAHSGRGGVMSVRHPGIMFRSHARGPLTTWPAAFGKPRQLLNKCKRAPGTRRSIEGCRALSSAHLWEHLSPRLPPPRAKDRSVKLLQVTVV